MNYFRSGGYGHGVDETTTRGRTIIIPTTPKFKRQDSPDTIEVHLLKSCEKGLCMYITFKFIIYEVELYWILSFYFRFL